MDEITITLEYGKSTPGTHVYKGPRDCCIPSLYIKRSVFGVGAPPATITVTVKEG